MDKVFHVNPNTGEVGICKAEHGQCPYSRMDPDAPTHFDNVQEAIQDGENRMDVLYSRLPVINAAKYRSARPGDRLAFSTKSGSTYVLQYVAETEYGDDVWNLTVHKKDGKIEKYNSLRIVRLEPTDSALFIGVDNPDLEITTSRVESSIVNNNMNKDYFDKYDQSMAGYQA